MIIDMHVHPIYYKAICKDEKEEAFRSEAFGVFKQSPYDYDEIFVEMKYAKVDMAALLPLDVTTTEGGVIVSNEQVAKIAADYPERFIGFASVDPRRSDALEILDYAFSTLKLEGLKLNPAKQHFYPNDKMMDPIYKKCLEYNKPIIFHAGLSWEPNSITEYAHPLKFEEVAVKFPQLRICLAHFAWPFVREMVMLMIKYSNVYTDTSVLYLDSPEESMKRLFTVDMGSLWVDRALHKQIMFGSNGPRFRQFKLLRALEQIPMRETSRDNIYYRNALRFIGREEF
ncbi:amidohydrolase family protein [Anaerosacchariphilus polymeriproducens]|uniref:Amidohydrolase n=1 Tax=Anaerosacchariphilus polymeriproducens TaxID=1812858 RepID=A0A371AWS5_9FIRM|nr:amidohydrolase family protein [Anaerosacchariphilus polymeriproducens]RDU24044.1 amidohydrolase [Anaerosacchariphilus polymeriproducens]